MSIEEEQIAGVEEYADECGRGTYLRAGLSRTSEGERDVVRVWEYVNSIDAPAEPEWHLVTCCCATFRFPKGSADFGKAEIEDVFDDGVYPSYDILRDELPEDMAEWVVSDLNFACTHGRSYPNLRFEPLELLIQQGLTVSAIKDLCVREYFEGLASEGIKANRQ